MTKANHSAARQALFDERSEARSYVLRGGDQAVPRLQLLARVMWPSTHALFNRIGIHRGMRCLDVGCGSGEVTLQLARLVAPEGYVVGIDADDVIVDRARVAASRQQASAWFETRNAEDLQEEAAYDLVHARFLLTHVPQPALVLTRLLRALRPAGTIVLQDIDFPGHVCHPPCPAFDRYVDLYQAVVRHRGGDPAIGPRLPALLHDAGVEDIRLDVVQPTFCDGEGKFVAQVTMEHIREAVVLAGLAAHAEVDAIIVELESFATDPRSLISLPRVFQVWARKPDD